MEAVVIHSESPSRLETCFDLVIMMAGVRVVLGVDVRHLPDVEIKLV